MKIFKRARKLFAVLTSILMLVQPILPVFPSLLHPVYAQEATPTTTPVPTPEPTLESTPEATPSPTEEVTPSPTEEPSPTPTEEVTPTLEPTPTETPIPTETVEPTPTASQEQPPQQNSEPPKETGPPPAGGQEQGQILDGVSTTPTPTPIESGPTVTVEEPIVEGELQAVILQNVEAESLNLDNVDPSNSATLTTDKADYAPTDTAVITGTNFTPGETYSLTISSNDQPPTSTTVEVTADENGSFVYAYQLDGTYRPNYKVEAKINTTIVAETSFTDAPASGCQEDSAGANDEVNQKDLTKMCVNYSGLPTSESVTWNWDDTGFSGSNTGDACSLYDTDGDGKANYALCVGISGNPAAWSYTKLYSCSDNSGQKCTSPSSEITSFTSSCTAGNSATDPFTEGNAYPNDTQASCTINLSDIGGASVANLVDVCSFESGSPTSNPADCILFKANAGKLTLTKVLSPSTDSGLFNLQIDGTTQAANVGNGGTTLTQEVSSTTTHTVGETAGTSTSLSNYTTSVLCKEEHGTGDTVSTTGSNPWTLSVGDGDDILCTITNTRINNASLTIVKDAVPTDPQDFSFTTSGTGLSNFSLDDDADGTLSNTTTFSSLAAGTYSVSETVPTGWVQTSATCNDGSPVSAIVLSAGENVTCTFTNTKKGQIIVEKQTLPDGSPQSFGFTADYDGDGFSLTDGQQNDSGFLVSGSYTVGETVPSGWDLTGIVCTDPTQNSSSNLPTAPTATVNLAAGETVTCVFTNTQRGSIIVEKQTMPDGASGNFTFTGTAAGTISDNGQITVNNLVPGQYTSTESDPTPGFDLTNITCDDANSTGDTGSRTAAFNVEAGETVQCNFTNTQRGSISGYKYEDKSGDTSDDGDQTPVEGLLVELWQWVSDTFVDTGKTDTTDSNGFYQFLDLIPGVYQVREILSSLGATWTNVTSTEIDVTVDPGEFDEDNNFINTQYGTIVVEKQTVPDGDQTVFDFDLNYGDNDADLSDGQQDSTGNLLPGSYSVSENTPEGWVLTNTTCTSSIQDTETAANLELDSGETITCVFTNSRKPTLTLVKTVINNNGGTAVASDFQGKINDGNVPWSIAQTLNPGSYTASESTLSNYTASVWGTNCNADGTITLAYGDNRTCSITNDDNAPALHLRKTITTDNGGTALITDWTLTATGTGDTPTNLSGSTPVDSGSGFKADTYALAESGGPSGYTAGTWDCGQATKTDPTHVVVPFGGNVTCTINNNDNAPSLTLNKVVVNDNGGNALESDWTLTATGPTSISGPGAAGDSDVVSGPSFDAGTYTLSESIGPAGYTASSWSCSGGSQNGNEITIGLGERASCTITNNDIAPTITLIKEVVNDDGGEAGSEDFTLSLGNNTVTSGVATTVEANTAYEVDEAGPLGYQFVSITGDSECPGALAGNVTADEGKNITCTITNDDIAPTLKLVKEVVIDNGGTAVADDWSLYASAYPNDSRNFNNLGGSGSFETVFANVAYDLSESSVLSGYSAGGWNCNGGNLVGSTVTLGLNEDVTCTITNDDETGRLVIVKVLINDDGGDLNNEDFSYTVNDGISTPFESDGQNEESVDSGNYTIVEDSVAGYETTYEDCEDIFVPNGGSATCTITNDDIAPTLRLVKEVTNDDGGDAVPADWNLTASGDGGFTDGGDSTTFHTVKANEPYTLSESTVAGYAEGSWDCDNAGLEGNVVLLGPGEEVTCTITNDDIAPTITLTKEVIGGTATADDFSLYLGGNSVTSGVANTVLANFPYDIDEDGPSGYTFTSLTGDPECPDLLRGDVEADEGENISCTITNTRDTGSLEVHKQVDTDADGIFEGGNTEANTLGFVWGIDSETPARSMGSTASPLDTGSHDVDENTDVGDYHFVGWFYDDSDYSCEEPEFEELPASIDVSKDLTTSITLCNARDTGTITVDKVTDPSESSQEFTIRLSQGETTISDYVIDDQDERKILEVPTGTYSLDELGVEGWDLTDATCTLNDGDPQQYTEGDLLELGYGDNITCTFENTQRGTVIVKKYNDANGNGTQDEGEDVLSDWTMNLINEGTTKGTTDENGEATFENMPPGTYELTEDLKNGWEQTQLACLRDRRLILLPDDATGDVADDIADDTAEDGTFNLSPGETQRCVVGNRQLNPILTISKSHAASDDVKNPGDSVVFTITVTATQSAAFNVFVTDLPANGFTYRTNSWTANSTARGDLKVLGITTQPTYASPGVWTLGDMEKDEIVTLTYIADISSDQKPGIYKDLAWGYGCRFETDCEVGDSNSVLSNAVSPGFVDDNFVGTEVEVVKDQQSGATLNKTEGEVLGAATELPATGADELWIKLAALLFLVGLGFIAAGKYTRRFYV